MCLRSVYNRQIRLNMINIHAVTLVLLLVLISFAECNHTGFKYFFNLSLRQKLKALENSLLQSQNLSKFSNSIIDNNNIVNSDRTKAKRLYDNKRCIGELEWIKNTFNNKESSGAFES